MMADRQPPRAPAVGRSPIRLAKLMADRALCSRREAERLIAAGSVRVDGRVIDQQGVKIDSKARIEIGEPCCDVARDARAHHGKLRSNKRDLVPVGNAGDL